MAVDDVVAEDQGDAEARLLDRDTLHFVHLVPAEPVEQAAQAPCPQCRHVVGRIAGAGDDEAGGQHVELADLLVERHGPQERVYMCFGAANHSASREVDYDSTEAVRYA